MIVFIILPFWFERWETMSRFRKWRKSNFFVKLLFYVLIVPVIFCYFVFYYFPISFWLKMITFFVCWDAGLRFYKAWLMGVCGVQLFNKYKFKMLTELSSSYNISAYGYGNPFAKLKIFHSLQSRLFLN